MKKLMLTVDFEPAYITSLISGVLKKLIPLLVRKLFVSGQDA